MARESFGRAFANALRELFGLAPKKPRTRHYSTYKHYDSPAKRGPTRAIHWYPGDFHGVPRFQYSPVLDGNADPGEVVWTWIPFEDDPTLGKDRPVLLIARDADLLVGLMLTSQPHDIAREAHFGRHWVSIGSGSWDRQRRPSLVRLDRMVRVDPPAVRREGAMIDRQTYDLVTSSLKALHDW